MSLLIKAYHTAQRGQTQVVLLEGEAGIGTSGEHAQAHQMFARAMAMVQKLAAKMEDEARRLNFLAEPAVRRVLERGRA